MSNERNLPFIPRALILVGICLITLAILATFGAPNTLRASASSGSSVSKWIDTAEYRSSNSPNSGTPNHKPPYCNPKNNKDKDKCGKK